MFGVLSIFSVLQIEKKNVYNFFGGEKINK